jgi:hypothetical protein
VGKKCAKPNNMCASKGNQFNQIKGGMTRLETDTTTPTNIMVMLVFDEHNPPKKNRDVYLLPKASI